MSGITKNGFSAKKLIFGIDRNQKVNYPDICTLCENAAHLIKLF